MKAPAAAPRSATRQVAFSRTKYGRELLVDVGRIRQLRHFIRDDAPHSLAFYDVMLVSAGRGAIEVDSQRHPLRAGAVFFTAPGQVRRFRVRGLDGWCLFFEGAFVRDFLADPLFLDRLQFFHEPGGAAPLQLRPAQVRALVARLRAMRVEIASARPDAIELLRAGLFETLVTLDRQYARARGRGPAGPPPALLRLRELIELHFRETHAVQDYARRLRVTPGHLSWLTRRHLGQSAGELLRGRVVTEARRLLAYGDDDVSAIAESLGFADASYFSRFFRRETGQAPADFRRAQSASL